MVVTCDFDFINNPSGTYYAGQTVIGRITLKADSPKDVKGVVFIIKGYAFVRWSEYNAATRTVHTYKAREDYIESSTYLMGSGIDDKTVCIEPGVLTYDFSCYIPMYCPSSFESQVGRIRYGVRVVLKRPWKFDQTFKRYFTVLKLMDLNEGNSLFGLPAQIESVKNYHKWLLSSDAMQVKVNLPQTGFVPGQMIPISVLIANNSSIPVEEHKVKLAMLVCYIASPPNHRKRNERFVLCKIKGDSVMQQCTKQFQYTMPVPATPPTCLNLCRIIKISYQIEIKTEVKGFHRKHIVIVPITIGSVPLSRAWQPQPSCSTTYSPIQSAEVAQPEAGKPEAAQQEAGKPEAAESGATASLHKGSEVYVGKCGEELQLTKPENPWSEDIPPPTYEEAVHIPKDQSIKPNDNTNTQEEEPFAPLYPVFHISTSTLEEQNFDFKEDNCPKKGN